MSRRDVRDPVYENDVEGDQEQHQHNQYPGMVATTYTAASPDGFFANLPPAPVITGDYDGAYAPVPAGDYHEQPQYANIPNASAHPMSMIPVSDCGMYPPALYDPSNPSSYPLPAMPAPAPTAAQTILYGQHQGSYPLPPTFATKTSAAAAAAAAGSASPGPSASSRGSKRAKNSPASSSRSRGNSLSSYHPKTIRPLAPAQPGTSVFPVSPTASSGGGRPQLRTASRAPKRYSPATAATRRPAENEDEERSRSLHNRAEQNYRQRLNGGYDELLGILPGNDDEDEGDEDDDHDNDDDDAGREHRSLNLAGAADKKRVSKAQVLDRAAKRIRALEEQGEQLRRTRLELQRIEESYSEGSREGLAWHGDEPGDGGEDGNGG